MSLRDEFGVAVLNPPSAPVILICPGQTERTLLRKRGVKRPDFLQEQIAACPVVQDDGVEERRRGRCRLGLSGPAPVRSRHAR